MSRTLVGSLVAVLALACAQTPDPVVEPAPSTSAASAAPAPSTAFNPVGSYSLTAEAPDVTHTGTLEIARGAQGGLVGTLHVDGGSLPLYNVTADGPVMRFSLVMPNGPEVALQLRFEGDEYRGTWSAEGMSGAVYGARRK